MPRVEPPTERSTFGAGEGDHEGENEVVWSIVVAGGSGARFGAPKQFEMLGGERVVDRSTMTARSVSDGVVVVLPADRAPLEGAVAGGPSRSASVRHGLDAVPAEATIVCVHDAARPLATAALFQAVIDAVRRGADAAVPGLPVTDTVKQVDVNGRVIATLDRTQLVAVQTPQAFRAQELRRAHRRGGEGSDDAVLVEQLGGEVVVVPGEASNRKLTHPEDLEWAEGVLAGRPDEVVSP